MVEVAENVRQGISVRTVLVYDGVLAKGVRGSGFFDALISAAELLGRGAHLRNSPHSTPGWVR